MTEILDWSIRLVQTRNTKGNPRKYKEVYMVLFLAIMSSFLLQSTTQESKLRAQCKHTDDSDDRNIER